MNKSYLRLLLHIVVTLVCVQSHQLLFGQRVYKIERLPESINSDFEEIKPYSTANGDSLFFIRAYAPDNIGGESAGEDIWLSLHSDKEEWATATSSFGYVNSQRPDIFAGLSRNGTSLYTIAYAHYSQRRIIEITENQFSDAAKSSSGSKLNTQLSIGFEYHDIYINPSATILLISMETLNSLGQEDIYCSIINEENTWSPPHNLGPVINSRGYEISPFLTADERILYFASDGHEGYGDADIFYSERLDESWDNWSDPKNMGTPINSEKFDAYFFSNQKNEIFFASNRNGQYADIYKAVEDKSEEIVADESPGSQRSLPEIHTSEISSQVLKLSIYFALDQFRPYAAELERLDSLATESIDHKDLHLDIIGYTDKSGTEGYNLKLSKKRAQFVYKYLKNLGYDKSKMTTRGMGVLSGFESETIPSAQMRKVDLVIRKKN